MFSNETVGAAFVEHRRATEELRSLYADCEGRDLTAEETVVEGRLNTAIDEALDHAERGNAYLGRERAADEARVQYENLQTEHRDDDGPADDLVTREAEAVRQLAAGEIRAIEFETRDLTAGTATDGAELVPQSMYQQIHGFMQAASS
ncbi:MAG: hypothetical protein GY925_29480, partial [Actinomycetia bacterium]|nr:hypothetical protein [Actinomycetes bacterium]